MGVIMGQILVPAIDAARDTVTVLLDCTMNDVTAHTLITAVPTVLYPITYISMSNASHSVSTVKHIRGSTVTLISQAVRNTVTERLVG